jgi:hypothetical protein
MRDQPEAFTRAVREFVRATQSGQVERHPLAWEEPGFVFDGFVAFDLATSATTIHGRRAGRAHRFCCCTARPRRT